MEKNVVELTKKLISIPSYVGSDCDEQKVAEFVFQYLKQMSWLQVEKQYVNPGRFNVIARDKYPTKVLFCGHLDTVQPGQGWTTDPMKPVVRGGRIYGLGSADMKSSIAAFLTALKISGPTQGLMILFYIDEEYDFLGMKKFSSKYKGLKPELIISGDGGDLQIGNGCRGLVEINFLVQGKTGHAARPWVGSNAIIGSSKAVSELIQLLKRYKSAELGYSTCNLAFMQGGLNLGIQPSGELILGREGNNIPDIAEFILDIRPANKDLNAKKVIGLVQKLLENQGLELIETKIRHDYGAWITKRKELNSVTQIISDFKFADIGEFGYIDTQMLWETFNQVPCLMLGAGELKVAHSPNEYVQIDKLNRLSQAFEQIIQNLLKGGENNHGNN